MKTLLLIALATLSLSNPDAADAPDAPDGEVAKGKVLLDQAFTLLEPGGDEGATLGRYTLAAEEKQGRIQIDESFELKTPQGAITMSSTVIYTQGKDKAWSFTSASGATTAGGDDVMKVSIKAKDKQWVIETTLYRRPGGEAFAEPKVIRRSIEAPPGEVLFSSARAVMGPRFQADAGTRPITWVEFPDDLDESVTIKNGFTLTRTAPDADGGYALHIRSEHQDLGPLPLTKEGQLKAHRLFGKIPMQEEEKEKA